MNSQSHKVTKAPKPQRGATKFKTNY